MILFIIFYGSYGITYSKGKGGEFGCPACSAQRAYRHRRVRRFFHIFFIPLLPLNLAGEYVECGGCKKTFKMDVLGRQLPAPAAKPAAPAAPAAPAGPVVSESQRSVRRVLALMTLADGRVEEAELAAIAQFLHYSEQRPVSRDEVMAEIEAARREPTDLEAYGRAMMGFLNDQGRADVLKAANVIASADGHVAPEEQRLLERLGIALGMRPAQVSQNLAAPVPQQARTPFCPRCGGQARWIADHTCWGCDRCQQPLPV